ncbi:glycoside hydrolase family 3 N-terminal domain-containing protein [Pajaroellobacter abortibovis]|uniref:Glycoside hydrolase family 3 N-terminal domain-containing protein n=1 Tax=Pajaroellobacter abortibovis TaxID=1882918 RepID=A0A1L6MXG2_9BACT|nr:hypothetical protein BCY86_05290 [Pajaroellobacter abortibovis]
MQLATRRRASRRTPFPFFLRCLQQTGFGGVILFRRNLRHCKQETMELKVILHVTQTLHNNSPSDLPSLLLGIDQEGGRGTRINSLALRMPSAAQLTSTGSSPHRTTNRNSGD